MNKAGIYSREAMELAFKQLREEIEKIETNSPRLERDRLYEDLKPSELRRYDQLIKEHERGLFDKKQELGNLARALKTIKG
jgi:hypothetical protein